MATISAIEGIADSKVEKLRAEGIRTTDALLDQANTAKRREKLSASTKITEKQLLGFVNQADLMRVKGVGGPIANLLDAVGVSNVKDLRSSDADELAAKLEKKNNAKKNPPVKRTPSSKVVQKWIDDAKGLKLVVRA